MIPVQEFLEQIEARGVRLRVNGESIRIGWPEKTPDPEIRQTIIERKPEIIEALSSAGKESRKPDAWDRMTDAEREAFEEYVEIMTSPKFNLPLDQAERETMRLVLRAKQALPARQAAEDYRRFGYVKIFSTVLKRAVYFVKDEQVAKNLPDQSLSVFMENEIRTCKGLCPEEAKLLLEAKIILNGTIG